ncbi:M16 family metallopeptidase [Sphingobacterium paludis]|uniref:Putative Zn-dependent peptidase n=1 Tax=Sphingobacterium paludis TaxID=1476465 RepID=A0A4R7CYQ3_9SPHI|nr:pitrilysin family protein [Sphingobacterium paludis]TDS12881.1 putative Zn-dependent peptidase [Sphingobacterium paludis]
MLNRSLAPRKHHIQHIDLIEPEALTFGNGLKAFVFRANDQDLVKAEFVFQNHFSIPENPLLHTCLSHMMKEGTTSRSSAQIAEEVDFYGAYLVPEYSFDHTSLTLYTLTKHVASVLPVLHDVLNHSVFPEAELETYIRNNKQTLQISLQKNDYVARRLFYTQLFGKNRYGQTPTIESYEQLNREDLTALYARQIQPGNCTLLLSGNVSNEIIHAFQELFGGAWTNDSIDLTYEEPVFPAFKPETIVENRSEALQSAIRLGMPGINRTHADYPAVQFVNTLFGGYFGSRLMRNIREEKGFTYSIGSALASLKYNGFFTIATEVGVESTQATLTEIEKEFAALSHTLASDQEIDLVKNYMLGSMLGSLESIFSHADKFKTVYFSGLTYAYFKHYAATIQQMNAQRVQEIARKYFNFNDLTKIIVGQL